MTLVDQFNLSTDDIKDLSIAALIAQLMGVAKSDDLRAQLTNLLGMAGSAGIADQRVSKLVLDAPKVTPVSSTNGNTKK